MEPALISIVIPTLNEEDALPRSIASVRQSSAEHEIIVVDGGSSDGTCSTAANLGAITFSLTPPRRAAQMNYGAARSTGEILLFLHADTRLPPGGLDHIARSLACPEIGGGAFARYFESPSLFLKCTCALGEARNRALGWHLGDQAMFVRRSLFERLQGFSAWDRFEDLDFSRRLGRISRLATLRPPVVSSARRFENGPLQRTMRDLLLTISYLRNGA